MSTPTTIKWIDLRDNIDKARLKIGTLTDDDGRQRRILFIVGLDPASARWKSAIDRLGFVASPKSKYLARQVQEGEKLQAKTFHSVWPNATLSEMPSDQVRLDLSATRRARETPQPRSQEEAAIATESGVVIRLGRNADGDEVYESAAGRYIQKSEKRRVYETNLLRPEMFLRAQDPGSLDLCADGFVQAMLQGEVQRSEDLDRFITAVTGKEGPLDAATYDQMAVVIDAALVRFLNGAYETAQDAYGDAGRLYQYLPPYRGAGRGEAAMPLPMAVIAQRLLGDTSGKRVLVPNAWDGASFAFLARGTQIHAFRGDRDLSRHVNTVREEDVTWSDRFDPTRDQGAEGLFFNADPSRAADGTRQDYPQALAALRALGHGARAVLVLAADDLRNPGELSVESRRFFDALGRRFDIEATFETGAELTRQLGTDKGLRLISLRNRPATANSVKVEKLNVLHSWDELKTVVDEAIVSIDLREAETESVDVEQAARENEFQRPYVAFSKVGEARTMVPKNLQGPLQHALSNLESLHGAVDSFVETELGFGPNTLGDRFSPEQVDAIGLGVARIKGGRGIIIGDETGIGKGRTLSGLATWANKQGRNIIFVTDRANLFSDLVRDLRDIGEWGRFQPFIMNSDGVLMDVFTNEVLQKGTPPKLMQEVLGDNRPMNQLGCNIIFATYSQISGEDSPKADWVLDQSEQALVIVDEAHVAAGSDSNTSRVVVDLVNRAWGVVYSSATWAKSSENLHVYGRAFSETINVASLSATMKSGGEPFSEVFSSMLARDGALIRREHDLSKIEFVVEIDEKNTARNSDLSDQVAGILAAMTYVAGDINKLLMRLNSDQNAILRKAREARTAMRAATPEEAAGLAAAAMPVRGTILKSHFGAGSVLYQVMRRFLSVLNADHVAGLALRAIEENRKPVIVFEDTGETFVKRLIQDQVIPGIEGEADVLPSHVRAPTIKDLLRHVMKRLGVVSKEVTTDERVASAAERRVLNEMRAEEEVDIDAVVEAQDASQARGDTMSVLNLPGLTPDQQKAYTDGIEQIMKMIDDLPPLPLNAIDIVQMRLAEAGLRVGEISGRKVRLEAPAEDCLEPIDSKKWLDSMWKITIRNTKKTAVNGTVFGFNSGEIDVVCANRSAATGLSLHASPRFDDTRRRELIEMQIPEDPTNRIQLYGRVNRYDQVVTPRISIATTGIFGEVRQLMQQNKKLARLSANIRSSRDNAAEIKFIPDLLNSVGEEVCRRFLEDNGGIRNRLGISDKDLEAPSFSASQRLTSRVALLRVAEQKMVYDEIYEMFADAINRHELAGENPLKSKEMDLRAKVKEQRIAIGVEMDGFGSAFDGPVYLKKIAWKEDLKPIDWPALVNLVNKGRADMVAAGHAKYTDEALVPARDTGEPPAQDLAEVQFEPLAFQAAGVAIEESSLLSTASGALQLDRENEPVGAAALRPVKMGPMVKHLSEILNAKTRIELAGSEFADVSAALTSEKSNGVKRAHARRLWVDEHLHQLVPGCVIGMPVPKSEPGQAEFLRRWKVVVAVRPPPKGKEAMISRWKVETVERGDEKPQVVTLASLMEGVDLISIQRNGMPATETVSDTIVEGDMFNGESLNAEMRLRRFTDDFDLRNLESGTHTRTAMVLDGNMYLAAEWAAATKQGRGVIYTDEAGLRHRAVMLHKGISRGNDLMRRMPVRLWSGVMVANFFAELLRERAPGEPEIPRNLAREGYLLPTDFRAAVRWDTGNHRADTVGTQVALLPGKGVALIVDRKDLARTLRALRGDQKNSLRRAHPDLKNYTPEQKAEAEAGLVKISSSAAKRGQKPMILLDCNTSGQFKTAVDLICRAAGIELYLPRATELGELADQVQRDYFEARKNEARAQLGLLQAAEQAADHAAVPQPEVPTAGPDHCAQESPDQQMGDNFDRGQERERLAA